MAKKVYTPDAVLARMEKGTDNELDFYFMAARELIVTGLLSFGDYPDYFDAKRQKILRDASQEKYPRGQEEDVRVGSRGCERVK